MDCGQFCPNDSFPVPCSTCDRAWMNKPVAQQVSSAGFTGSIADPTSVVADYVAFCPVCNGWVGAADASTPEMKKSHQGDIAIWIDEGYRVELIEHRPKDPMPPMCKC